MKKQRIRVNMRLYRQEGEDTVHIMRTSGKARCGKAIPKGITRVEPLAVSADDICPDCLVKHMRRKT